jgi:hypothetical protein
MVIERRRPSNPFAGDLKRKSDDGTEYETSHSQATAAPEHSGMPPWASYWSGLHAYSSQYSSATVGSVPTTSATLTATEAAQTAQATSTATSSTYSVSPINPLSTPLLPPQQSSDPNPVVPSYNHKMPVGHMFASIMIPIVLIAVAGGVILCCIRRRKRRQMRLLVQDETKAKNENNSEQLVEPTRAMHDTTDQSQPNIAILPAAHTPNQPIILSPMPSNNGAYFTGIDTSDVLSINSTGTRATHLDEPPPPYRPRSIVATALSGDSSLHQPSHVDTLPARSLNNPQPLHRSPFADPSESDGISEISEQSPETPTKGRPPF